MKKFLLSFMMIFSLSHAQQVWAFSEEVLNASIEEYLQFFEEGMKSAETSEEEIEPSPEELSENKTAALGKQMMLSRRAQALASAVVDIGNEAHNIFLLQLMKHYVEEADHRPALQLLIDELIKVVQPELEARENHRVWKSAVRGGSDGFYVLATLEVLNAVGKKTGGFAKLANMLQKTNPAAPIVMSEATDLAVSGGAASVGTHLPAPTAQIVAKATSRGNFLKGLLSFRPSLIQVERWLGKSGLPRMGRFITVGVLLGMLYDGYIYHWTEQKLNPSLLFEMIQMLAILDLAARVVEFKSEISSDKNGLSLEQKIEFLESHKAAQALLENEFKHFETAAPKFLANVAIDVSEFEDHPFNLFLDSFYEANPQVKEALIKKEVSSVSLSPIELMLQDTAIQQSRLVEKMMREALTRPSQPTQENR